MTRTLKTVFCLLAFFALAPFSYAQESEDDYAEEPAVRVVSVEDVINPHTADASDYVSDMAGVFTPEQESQANALCLRMDSVAKIQTLVVTVPSIGYEDPFQYSVDLFQRIGVGDKKTDRGLLILVAVSDHKWEIRTGYGLEGQFTDAICSYVGRNKMVPKFRDEDYAGGIIDAVEYFTTLSTDEKALEELNLELKNAEDRLTRDDLYGLWIMIAVLLLVTYGSYRVMRVEKKKSDDASSDVALQDNTLLTKWTSGELMIPQKFSVTSVYGSVTRVEQAKDSGIKYWDKNKPTRWLLYYAIPSLATGVVCETSQSMESLLLMILLCNTWASLVYFVSRFKMVGRAVSPYEKHRVYDEGVFSGKAFVCMLLAPWVAIPALIYGAGGRRKYKNVGPACPECGCDMFKCEQQEDLLPLLDEREITERRIRSNKFTLYKCANGHSMIDIEPGDSSYIKCPKCGAKASKKNSSNTITVATYTHSGEREDIYKCEHCGGKHSVLVVIPKRTRSSSSSSGGGRSSRGGSYGGGSTGGGGAGGSW